MVCGIVDSQFFDQWYYGQGYPSYDIEYYMEGNHLKMNVTQSTSTSATTLFEMLMEYKLEFFDGTDTIVKLFQSDNVNSFSVDVGKKEVVDIEVDPEQWTMEQVGSISVTVEETKSPLYFTIGPNPVSDQLNIYFLNDANASREVKITDMSGKILSTFSTQENHIRYDASTLNHGAYLVQITDGQNKKVKRFVK